MSSIYTGVAGMQAHQAAVDVIANNIANLNTIGYKAHRMTFAETLVQTLSDGSEGINPMQIGTGVGVGSIDVLMTQGSLRSTGRMQDIAINGNGFLIVHDRNGNSHYTRAGDLVTDLNNRLMLNSNNMAVQGWQANILTGEIDTNSAVSDITIPIGARYAVATTNAALDGNLDSNTEVDGTVATTFSVYDSLGAEHEIDIEFQKTGDGSWSWTATSDDAEVGTTLGSGTLSFDSAGEPTGTTSGSIELTLANPNGATNPLAFELDLSAINQFNSPNEKVQLKSQDGLSMGTLDSFSLDGDGVISGQFSNGATRVVGRIALATFDNPAGLISEGGNLLNISPNSGIAMIQAPDRTILSGNLEMSNVDLATEFANLIVAQRGYQANSRSITTADDMMQEVLQVKR